MFESLPNVHLGSQCTHKISQTHMNLRHRERLPQMLVQCECFLQVCGSIGAVDCRHQTPEAVVEACALFINTAAPFHEF
jgi:hypothetical protein